MLMLEGISLWRGQESILDHLSLSLNASDGLLIQGPNGCGKTTLLQIVAGLLAPSKGHMTWQGKPMQEYRPNLGYLFVNAPLFRELSVHDNLCYWMALHGQKRFSLITSALAHFHLTHKSEALASTLSSGERQRVHLAKLLLTPLSLWLLDEVTTHLDSLSKDQLEDAFQKVRSEGSILLCVSHTRIKALNKTLIFEKRM